jgi:HTH-type transcriptional regulator / antitoxin HipB
MIMFGGNLVNIIARTTKQTGAALRRIRRQRSMTQAELGQKMHVRQATVSKLEAGEPATQLRIFMDALSALDLELVIRPRSSAPTDNIEDLF